MKPFVNLYWSSDMQKYKVVNTTNTKRAIYPDNWEVRKAKELQEEFGLNFLTLEEIYLIWSNYSEDYYAASWLAPIKSDVEKAFGVVLEEI